MLDNEHAECYTMDTIHLDTPFGGRGRGSYEPRFLFCENSLKKGCASH